MCLTLQPSKGTQTFQDQCTPDVFTCECPCGRRCCLPSWHAGHLGGSHRPASLVLVGITGGSGGSPCLPLRFNIRPWIHPNPACPNLACHNNSSFSGLERLWLFLSSNDNVVLRSLFFSQLWAWFDVMPALGRALKTYSLLDVFAFELTDIKLGYTYLKYV